MILLSRIPFLPLSSESATCPSEFSSVNTCPRRFSCFLHPSLDCEVGTFPVCSSPPYLWLSATFDHQGYGQEMREKKSEIRLLIPSFFSAWSLQADCVLCPWPQLLSGSSLHTGLPLDAKCSLYLSLFRQRSVYDASS